MTGRATYWELRKLMAQRRTYFGLALAVLFPIGFAIGLTVSPPPLRATGTAPDELFGAYLRVTGLVLPFITLVFSSLVFLPAVAALVAGDIIAAENDRGTLKMILTRGLTRTNLFTAKVLATFTYVLVMLLLFVLVGIVAGGIAFGVGGLRISGQNFSETSLVLRAFGAGAVFGFPLLAVTSFGILFSSLWRNSAGAVVGTIVLSFIVQFVPFIPGVRSVSRPLLLARQFTVWQDFLSAHLRGARILEASAVSLLYAAIALFFAWRSFVRRDVLG